jgi:hypothetical protein
MANTSILAAFERMWQHVVAVLGSKADINHNHDDIYYTESEIDSKLSNKASSSHNHSASEITSDTLSSDRLPTVPVTKGGTGATMLSSGQALIGGGKDAITTRAIQNNLYNTDAITASTNLVNMNTLRYALNRTTGICTADSNYGTVMMRGIKMGMNDMTAGSSELTSGAIYLVYE